MDDAERFRVYLAGWDDGERCLLDALLMIPVEHWEHVVRHRLAEINRRDVTR